MPAGDVETYYDHSRNAWLNKIEGRAEALGEYRTKAEAVEEGRRFAIYVAGFAELHRRRTVEHIIRNEDGTIGERNTYPWKDDPRTSRG